MMIAARVKDLANAARMETQATHELDNLKQELTLVRAALTLRLKWLHPLNTVVVANHSVLANTALVLGEYGTAHTSYAALVAAFQRYYPRNHPLIAINQSILGELLASLEQREAALEHLSAAYNIFLVSRGAKAQVTQTLFNRVASLKLGIK
jgi:tetratricopeptide (TPR) repeat protein